MPVGVPHGAAVADVENKELWQHPEDMVKLYNHQPTLVLLGHSHIPTTQMAIPRKRAVIYYTEAGKPLRFYEANYVLSMLDREACFAPSVPGAITHVEFKQSTSYSPDFVVHFTNERVAPDYKLGIYELQPERSGAKLVWVAGEEVGMTSMNISAAFELADKRGLHQVLALCCHGGEVKIPDVSEAPDPCKDPCVQAVQLQNAAKQGDIAAVRALLNGKVDVNKSDANGDTPLWSAASLGNAEVVQQLIAAKANVDKPDSYGGTPLGAAARFGHEGSLQLLIDNKADVHIADNDGDTALAMARKKSHFTIAKLLEKAGARK